MNLDEWISDVEGRSIGSGECVGLAQDYSNRVVTGGFLATDKGPYPGYAGNMWTSDIPGYTRKPATSIMLPGWLPVWGKSPFTPSTHVAVGLADVGLGVYCMTQNPGPATKQTISKVGLLGYLAPNTGPQMVGIAGDVAKGVQGSLGALDSLKESAEWFTDPDNWKRVGLYSLGAVLVIFAIVFLFKDNTLDLVKGATN